MTNRFSFSMLLDLYQLTMAHGYWKTGKSNQPSIFHLYFRNNPFNGGFLLYSGLQPVLQALENFTFEADDIAYLQTLQGTSKPLFEQGFLDFLKTFRLQCDIDAMPEGTPAFPQQPLLRVSGGLLECQLLETLLLNIINFHSLVSTKAARVCHAACQNPVLEFGLRRAQGPDGGLMASRAAYIGGCSATSNVLAGKKFDIPVKGTHSHSWVMSFENEKEAFRTYAKLFPHNCIFLVDTYDSIQGIKHAIEVAQEMREPEKFAGVRLDSGDLAYLSKKARQMLDQAGFKNAEIFAGNDLDEYIISSLKLQKAEVGVWAVGTHLVTCKGQSSLGGVYKLSSIERENGWTRVIKLSEDHQKINTPGILQTRRFFKEGKMIGDAIYDIFSAPSDQIWRIINPTNPLQQTTLSTKENWEDLLVPVLKQGIRVYEFPSIHEIRAAAQEKLLSLDESVKRFVNPHQYPAGLEETVYYNKMQLITQAKKINL